MPVLFFAEKGRPGAALFISLSQALQYATLLPSFRNQFWNCTQFRYPIMDERFLQLDIYRGRTSDPGVSSSNSIPLRARFL